MTKIHMHKDYHTTFCGKDASHIAMTRSLDETTCMTCKKKGEAHAAKVADELAEQEEQVKTHEAVNAAALKARQKRQAADAKRREAGTIAIRKKIEALHANGKGDTPRD